jgi:hypothetical protein
VQSNFLRPPAHQLLYNDVIGGHKGETLLRSSMMNEYGLEGLVQEIAHDHPNGLTHADFVRKIRSSGYSYNESQPLSARVHQIIKSLVTQGVLARLGNDEDNSSVREYYPAWCEV